MPLGGKLPAIPLPATLMHGASVIKPFVCAAFIAAMAALTVMSRRESNGDSGGSEPDGELVVPAPRPAPTNGGSVAFGKR